MAGDRSTETQTGSPPAREPSPASLLGRADTVAAAPPAQAQASPRTATVTARGAGRPDLAMIEVKPDASAAALPPSLQERYECTALLGKGGMGVVHRAWDRRLGREVALKFLTGDDPDLGERLLREARSQARVDHPNACKVYEVGVSDGTRYIVMQLVNGASFDAIRGEMTLEEKARVVRQIALALHEAHRLGIVHRDVKPNNIMVERAEDGALRPFLMDFGIARDVGAAGQTATGVVAGTPAFMAPEQARGEIRSLDRRTDVYSLGATLYDVLAGRPPFVAPNTWQLLEQIKNEEAPPIRRLAPDIPEDIEAILAACLEKEPRRRYESAKALGEDLQRFLDGDPVSARRLSPGYRLLRKARKHRGLVALSGAALLAAIVVATLWIRGRRLAAEEANLARELGEEAKAMEVFLRIAHGLPLHDVEQEKDVMRSRLQRIEARMLAAGRAGQGPGQYALGRGYLALQEPEQALSHLRMASAAGYSSPDLDYAMGLSLGELFTKASREARRIDNPERRKARVAAIEAEYKDPALGRLRAALGASIESAAYVEGVIALYEDRYEDAIAKAKEAHAKAPWLYEAKKLEGDARFAMGSKFRHDAAFDVAAMMDHFQRAAEAYGAAAEVARSDPQIHEAECALWVQVMNAATARKELLRPSLDKARAACGRAIAASSRRDAGHLDLAFVQASFAWLIVGGALQEDPGEAIRAALALGQEAMRRSPREPMAPYLVGYGSLAEVSYLDDRGLDSGPAFERGVAAYEQAIRLDPTFLWAVSELGLLHATRVRSEALRGVDPAATVARALASCARARELDPSFLGPRNTEIIAHLALAEHLADEGRDPTAELATIRRAVETGRKLSRDWPAADGYLSYVQWFEARHELHARRDPSGSIDEGMRLASTPAAMGKLGITRALHLLGRGEDPEPALRGARESFQRASEAAPWDLGYRVWRARVEIVHLRWAARVRRLDEASFGAARAPLLALLDQDRVDPRLYEAMAEIDAIEATWLLDERKSAREVIARGLAMVDRALARNPRMAPALAARDELQKALARAAR